MAWPTNQPVSQTDRKTHLRAAERTYRWTYRHTSFFLCLRSLWMKCVASWLDCVKTLKGISITFVAIIRGNSLDFIFTQRYYCCLNVEDEMMCAMAEIWVKNKTINIAIKAVAVTSHLISIYLAFLHLDSIPLGHACNKFIFLSLSSRDLTS